MRIAASRSAPRLIAASRGLSEIIRHRRDSPPSDEAVSGLMILSAFRARSRLDTYHTQAAKLVDLIWLLPHASSDEKAWTAKTLRSRAAYLCVGALRVAADAHQVEEPSSALLEKAVPDLFAQQCRQSDARECELYVRQHIGWRILTPTPLHFLRIYVSKRPLYPESTDVLADHHRNQPVNDEVRVERLFLYVQKWCCFFCSMLCGNQSSTCASIRGFSRFA